MEDKARLIVWVVLAIVLFIGCVFAFAYWIQITTTLKNPCLKCGEKEKPEIAPCLFEPIPERIKINISLEVG